MAADKQLTGGRVNYYLVQVDHPQRESQSAYQAECEDIIEALQLNPDEANIFKEIWRSAAARLHNGKPGHTAIYGAEKIVHYAGRILRRIRRQTNEQKIQELVNTPAHPLAKHIAAQRAAGTASGLTNQDGEPDKQHTIVTPIKEMSKWPV